MPGFLWITCGEIQRVPADEQSHIFARPGSSIDSEPSSVAETTIDGLPDSACGQLAGSTKEDSQKYQPDEPCGKKNRVRTLKEMY